MVLEKHWFSADLWRTCLILKISNRNTPQRFIALVIHNGLVVLDLWAINPAETIWPE